MEKEVVRTKKDGRRFVKEGDTAERDVADEAGGVSGLENERKEVGSLSLIFCTRLTLPQLKASLAQKRTQVEELTSYAKCVPFTVFPFHHSTRPHFVC
jgi:hypothetical protein